MAFDTARLLIVEKFYTLGPIPRPPEIDGPGLTPNLHTFAAGYPPEFKRPRPVLARTKNTRLFCTWV